MHPFTRKLHTFAAVLTLCTNVHAADPSTQTHFASPEEAVKILVTSVKERDKNKLLEVLGMEAKPILESGDVTEDQANRERFLKAYDEGNKLDKVSDTKFILSVGKDDWPFPIPLIKEDKGWYFDTDAGKEEILNRRIGRNELSTIKAIGAYVNPQENISSPLEKEFAKGGKAGTDKAKTKSTSEPYFGYLYRILKGKKTDDYTLIAWPVNYGNTGVMTFIVNKEGKIYEKDLGSNTKAAVQKITTYKPDNTWKKVKQTDK